MTTYIALIRGINVGGHKLVAMADLRGMLADLGVSDPQTLLQSGNVVFRSRAEPVNRLEDRLGRALTERLGLDADFVIRTAAEWPDVISSNPFAADATRDPGRAIVFFLKHAARDGAADAVRAAATATERAHVAGRHVYAVYPDGMGRSKLTGAVVERLLGTRATARNWNTVPKLRDLSATIDASR